MTRQRFGTQRPVEEMNERAQDSKQRQLHHTCLQVHFSFNSNWVSFQECTVAWPVVIRRWRRSRCRITSPEHSCAGTRVLQAICADLRIHCAAEVISDIGGVGIEQTKFVKNSPNNALTSSGVLPSIDCGHNKRNSNLKNCCCFCI